MAHDDTPTPVNLERPKPPKNERRCAICDEPFEWRAAIHLEASGVEICIDCFAGLRNGPVN